MSYRDIINMYLDIVKKTSQCLYLSPKPLSLVLLYTTTNAHYLQQTTHL